MDDLDLAAFDTVMSARGGAPPPAVGLGVPYGGAPAGYAPPNAPPAPGGPPGAGAKRDAPWQQPDGPNKRPAGGPQGYGPPGTVAPAPERALHPVNGVPPQQQQQQQQAQQQQAQQQQAQQQQGGHGPPPQHGPPHGGAPQMQQGGGVHGPPGGQGGPPRGPPGGGGPQGYGGPPPRPANGPPHGHGHNGGGGGGGGGHGGGYQLARVPPGGNGGRGGGHHGGGGHDSPPGSPDGGGALVPLAAVLPELPASGVFNQMQRTALQVLSDGDYQMAQGKRFIKKNGWRRLAFYFNISTEIRSQNEVCDANGNVMRATFVVRASMSNGRYSDAYGSCDRGEKRFMQPNRDVPATAETRASTRAIQNLLGMSE